MSGEGASEGEGAEAGGAGSSAGPRRSDDPSPSPKRRGGKKRGEPLLTPELRAIVQDIGAHKVVPDTSAEERFISRSFRYRELILAFLLENVGSTWIELSELYVRAANAAGCSSVTAGRWVRQYTAVGSGTGLRLIKDLGYWILERKGP